eukprot:TRINITY_DN4091_c0_g1_i1.p1 TRINITY_DN4091_c0_g1~~TRINITY_DN4091_c0_g1_i1.p1  ORF type:complete len:483 (-),score=149.29 TRINITY_DN4091_c0_g1_i1:1148-2596(-)
MSRISKAQLQNGLRHDDFERYRIYCVKRVKRLRIAMHLSQSTRRSVKFCKRNVEPNMVNDPRMLEIPLMTAERAWTMWMALKHEETPPQPRVRIHMIHRLKKAVKWAAQLDTLCKATANSRTSLEATAYRTWMEGNLQLELEQWQQAQDLFETSHKICEQIEKIADTAADKHIFADRVAEVEPKIRFCAYNLRGQQPVTAVTGETSAEVASKLEELIAARNAEKGKQAEKQQNTKQKGEQQQQQPLLQEWALPKVVERNLALIRALQRRLPEGGISEGDTCKVDAKAQQKPSRPEEIVRLYDVSITAVNEMPLSPALKPRAQGVVCSFKAFRCYYMSLALTAQCKWAEAIALLDLATTRVNAALTSNAADADGMRVLKSHIDTWRYSVAAKAYAAAHEPQPAPAPATKEEAHTLSEALEGPCAGEFDTRFVERRRLAELPPRARGVGCDPLVFDLALGKCEYPSLEARKKPARTGFFSSFWR